MPILYHLSPENFSSFDAGCTGENCSHASRRLGEPGIFFTTNFRDVLKWAGVIATTKGSKARNKGPKRERINEEFRRDEREDPVINPPREQGEYKFLYLYKAEISHEDLRKVKERNRDYNNKDSGGDDMSSFYASIGSWDAEIFVPADIIPRVKIVGVRKYEAWDLIKQDYMLMNKEKSHGYRDKYWNKTEKKSQQKVYDYEETLEARKRMDQEFPIGTLVQWGPYELRVKGMWGRNVELYYPDPDPDYRRTFSSDPIDLLDFLNNAKKIDEEKLASSWYPKRIVKMGA